MWRGGASHCYVGEGEEHHHRVKGLLYGEEGRGRLLQGGITPSVKDLFFREVAPNAKNFLQAVLPLASRCSLETTAQKYCINLYSYMQYRRLLVRIMPVIWPTNSPPCLHRNIISQICATRRHLQDQVIS